MLLLIGILVFSAVTFTLLSVLPGRSARMTRTGVGLSYREMEAIPGVLPQEMTKSVWRRFVYPQIAFVLLSLGKLLPAEMAQRTDLRLEQAGRPGGLTARVYLGAQLLLAGLAVGALLVLHHFHPLPGKLGLALLFAVPVMAALAPNYFLDGIATTRRQAVRSSLPDIIDLLVISVGAGLSLDSAVSEVVAREHNVLGWELGHSLEEMRAGRTREESWKAMARRLRLPELNAFVSAICQGERMGVGIGQVLHAHADAMRIQRSLYARELAAKIPVKMLFPMVFFIFPCLFVVVLGPGVVQLMHSFRGVLF